MADFIPKKVTKVQDDTSRTIQKYNNESYADNRK